MKNAGDPVSAKEFTALQRAARMPQIGGDGVNVSSGPGGLHVKARSPAGGTFTEAALMAIGVNTGGSDLDKYSVCEIVGSYNSGYDAQWRRQVEVQLPSSAATGYFAVCAQDIDDGYANNIYLAGVCLVKIQTATGDLYADTSSGHDYLVGSPTDGGAQILWEEGGPSATTHLALIRFPRGGSGGGGNATALYCIDTNLSSLSGATTADGATPTTGDILLLAGQSTTSQNGLWKYNSAGAWTRAGTITSGMIVTVLSGTEYAKSLWILTTTGTITVGTTGQSWSKSGLNETRIATCATTANITLSGSQTIDGISSGTGFVLVKNQSTASQNGLYLAASGAWKKCLYQPTIVHVLSGTVGGRKTWFNTASNTWKANQGVYAA